MYVLIGARHGALVEVCAYHIAVVSIGSKLELAMYKCIGQAHNKKLVQILALRPSLRDL